MMLQVPIDYLLCNKSLWQFIRSLLITCCLLPTAALANDPFTNNSSKLGPDLLTQQDEFLPVADAFIPDYRIDDTRLLVHWKIAEGYYLYQERFHFSLADGAKLASTISEGKLKYDELFERETIVHYHDVTVSLDVSALTTAQSINIEYQGCADAGLCYPPQTLSLRIDPIKSIVTQSHSLQNPHTASVTPPTTIDSIWLLQAIVFALLGGAILNLMPCVFPVLSIKVMSLATANRTRLALHGWAYTFGIVTCFVSFAIALLVARLGGEAVGWGFQLQSPGLIAALAYLFFIMGLSMSGLIHFGTGLMGTGQHLTQKSGLTGSFFTGVLAAVVASPCTAPFMGAALGFALTQPALVCIAVFAALGFGMAVPLLLLCYSPALAARLPKPGVWMDNLKHVLAYPLYLTAVWLLWVFGRQTDVSAMAALCAGAVAIAFGCWLTGKEANGLPQFLRRLTIVVAWVIALILPWQQLRQDPLENISSNRWQPYNPTQLEALRKEGFPVFINLTADWCLTCLVNERLTLNTVEVEQAFDKYQVQTMRGDWTDNDPDITALLTEYSRSGVPLYLWFPANRPGQAEVLPQILTKDRLLLTIKSEK